ncbi:DUF167 domain-containing protein [Planctomycetota bacterium]
MAALEITEVEGGVVFGAKIVPGSSKTVIAGTLDGRLKVKVAAAPEKGKANDCLVGFLSKRLGVKKNAIEIVAGKTRPIKQILVSGVSRETVLSRLFGQ